MVYVFVVVFSYFLGGYWFDLFAALKGKTMERIGMTVFTVAYVIAGLYLGDTVSWWYTAVMWVVLAAVMGYIIKTLEESK